MLFSKPTRYGSGITLYGDFKDLETAYDLLHSILNKSTLSEDMRLPLYSVAYDLRHALQGDREITKISTIAGDVTYYGANITWPLFLMALGILRWLAGRQSTSKTDQAVLYTLEACADSALLEYDPKIGGEVMKWLTLFPPFDDSYIHQIIFHASLIYVSTPKAGMTRFKMLPDVMYMLRQGSRGYYEFLGMMEKRARELGCTIGEIRVNDEYPDFKW